VHGPDRFDDFFRRRALHHVAGGAGFERAPHVFALRIHGEHDHAATRVALEDRARGIGTIQLWHGQVHEHDVGLQLARLLHRLAPVADAGDHLDVALGFDQVAQPFGHHGVIVGDQDSDRHQRGTFATTRVPAPGAVSR
jgi:hypothetical protein